MVTTITMRSQIVNCTCTYHQSTPTATASRSSVISNRIASNIVFLFTWRYLLPSAASVIWLVLMLLVSHVQTSVGINPTIAFHQENGEY